MDLGLRDVHVLVTGASGGVGLAAAEEFLRQGSRCSLHYNTQTETLQQLLARYPDHSCAVQADVRDEAAVNAAMETARTRFGPVQVLILNHGIWPAEDIAVKDMTLAQWNNTIDVNLTGSFLFARAYLKAIEQNHVTHNVAIVIIGSTAGKFGEAYHADYSCTKSALMYGFTLSLKNEIVKIAPRGRVNCVAPGWIRTPMAERAMKDLDVLFQALATSPLKKVSEPIDVARAILFLASESASGNITGHVIDLNAGMEGRLLNSRSDFTSS